MPDSELDDLTASKIVDPAPPRLARYDPLTWTPDRIRTHRQDVESSSWSNIVSNDSHTHADSRWDVHPFAAVVGVGVDRTDSPYRPGRGIHTQRTNAAHVAALFPREQVHSLIGDERRNQYVEQG